MTIRHQRGHLRCTTAVWEFLWRENDPAGKRLGRTTLIGTVEQYPTHDLALAAVNGLRVTINEACNRQRSRSMLFGDLVPVSLYFDSTVHLVSCYVDLTGLIQAQRPAQLAKDLRRTLR